MLNPGMYYAKAIQWGTAKSEKGSEYIFIEWDVTHRADGESWSDLPTPERRTMFLYLTENAWPITKDKLSALGFNGDFGDGMDFSAEAKDGFQVECRHETYNGKTRDKWDIPGKGIQHRAADNATVRKLNAMWKQQRSAGQVPTPRPLKPPATDKDKDGVPF